MLLYIPGGAGFLPSTVCPMDWGGFFKLQTNVLSRWIFIIDMANPHDRPPLLGLSWDAARPHVREESKHRICLQSSGTVSIAGININNQQVRMKNSHQASQASCIIVSSWHHIEHVLLKICIWEQQHSFIRFPSTTTFSIKKRGSVKGWCGNHSLSGPGIGRYLLVAVTGPTFCRTRVIQKKGEDI